MKEYLLVFRAKTGAYAQPTEEALAASMAEWKNWIGGIAQQGKLTGGQPLAKGGRLMTSDTHITDAPFAEGKEVVNGYLIIKAADFNEACQLSKGCPIFNDPQGSLEVREIMPIAM